MVFEAVTALDGAEVLRRAKTFFGERIPMQAAFPDVMAKTRVLGACSSANAYSRR